MRFTSAPIALSSSTEGAGPSIVSSRSLAGTVSSSGSRSRGASCAAMPGSGRPRSWMPSRSRRRIARGGRLGRSRRKPRARTGRRGISASQSSSARSARASAAAATSGSSSARCAASSGLRKCQPESRLIAARSRGGIDSPSAPSRSHADDRSLPSCAPRRAPSRSSNCLNCVRAARPPLVRWRSTVARRSSNCIGLRQA